MSSAALMTAQQARVLVVGADTPLNMPSVAPGLPLSPERTRGVYWDFQGPFGVMGAYMQPQGHVQVLMNMLHFNMNPQEALDAPRWQWTGDKYIEIEPGFGESIAQALIAKGHDVNIQPDFISFGRGQIIVRDENGVLMGATEPRADGCVASW